MVCNRVRLTLISVFVLSLMLPLAATQATAAERCVIAASKGGPFRFDTGLISNCVIDTSNGHVTFSINGKPSSREYLGRTATVQKYADVAGYWLARVNRFRIRPNPANFDIRVFLEQAVRADTVIVFVRKRGRKQALNIAYITDGVWRSIDLPGINPKDRPVGFLTTGLN